INAASRNGDRGEYLFTRRDRFIAGFGLQLDFLDLAQFDFAEYFATGWTRFQDEKLSVLGSDIKLAIGQHRRCALKRSDRMLPQFLAGVDVECKQVRAIVNLVDPVTVDDRRRISSADACDRPLDLILTESAFAGCV